MKKPKIYLAGETNEQNYRDLVKKQFNLLLDFIDPFESVDHDRSPDSIVKQDMKLIDKCDLFLAYVNTKSFGTVMEIKYAYDNLKPVYVITTPEYSKDFWLSTHSTKTFFDIDTCLTDIFNYFRISYKKSEQNINKLETRGGKMDKKDGTFEGVNTNLIAKNHSPLIIRKYNIIHGWPLYIALICDYDLSDLDVVVNKVVNRCKENDLVTNNIQKMRNVTGVISGHLIDYYNGKKENCVEGVAVTLYIDKLMINNYFGDFMNHAQCRNEHLQLLNMMTQI